MSTKGGTVLWCKLCCCLGQSGSLACRRRAGGGGGVLSGGLLVGEDCFGGAGSMPPYKKTGAGATQLQHIVAWPAFGGEL